MNNLGNNKLTHTTLTWLHRADDILPILVILFALGLVLWLVRYIASVRWLLGRKLTYLELTPPSAGAKDPSATGQLFSVLHGLGMVRTLKDKLLRRKLVWSLEVVSSREHGIRYIVGTPELEVDSFRHAIAAYMPEVQVQVASDYLPASLESQNLRVMEFKQTGHFAYPLARHEDLESYDPMAHLAGAMTQLKNGELMSLQLVVAPLPLRHTSAITRKLLNNEDLLSHLSGKRTSLLQHLLYAANRLMFGITGLVTSIIHGSSEAAYQSSQRDAHDKLQIIQRLKPARQLSSFEQELAMSIDHKVRQPLFQVSVRALVVASSKSEATKRMNDVRASLASFTVPKYQSLTARRGGWLNLVQRYRLFALANRLPALLTRHSSLLAVSEVAGMYHFPHPDVAKTENVVKSLSRTLPAPIAIKHAADTKEFDVMLARNLHHGTTTSIGLTAAERERHLYVVGGTGNGKTTMLMYAIVQDIQNGKGAAVIDPHGDLAETILRHVPKKRIEDVIYFNPIDVGHPVGLNLLELPEGVTGDELLIEKDLVTESVISIFRKIFSEDDSGGHRIEYVLRNTIQTALTIEGATLFTIFRLLNNTKYRKKITKNLKDEDLKNFWDNELSKAGDFQRVKMSAGITAKIGRFLFSASAKRILEQDRSTIDFDEILDSGKILICNFSKGLLGEDTSALLGMTVLAKLQMAALRRVRVAPSERRDFYLYVDEFQNFATMSFVQMLSEARKYKLFLTMAEQSTSQQDQQRLVDIILANVGTVVCFRSASPADERFLLPLFTPYIDTGEISNLPSYNFYIRINAVAAQEPTSGETVLLEDDGSKAVAEEVKEYSRQHYAIEYTDKPEKAEEPAPKKVSRTRKPKDNTAATLATAVSPIRD